MKIHVKIQETSYEVKIGDINSRPIKASVDGETFEVWPEDIILPSPSSATPQKAAPIVSQAQVDAPAAQPNVAANEISAPIPGVIIEILIKAGEKVNYGQELCILEAMKMKNSIRASKDGTIKEILVSQGTQVKHGQALIRFEE